MYIVFRFDKLQLFFIKLLIYTHKTKKIVLNIALEEQNMTIFIPYPICFRSNQKDDLI